MNSLPKRLAWVSIFAIVFLAPALGRATQVTYDLETLFLNNPSPGGPGPWLQATFDDTNQPPGTVLLTLYASGITGSEFIDSQGKKNNWGWYFNIDPKYAAQLGDLNIEWQSGDNSPEDIKIGVGSDEFKAGGDGYFDLAFAWPKPEDRFRSGQTDVFRISGIDTLTAWDFNYPSAGGGGQSTYYTVAHVQGVENNSSWIADTDGGKDPPVNVPEPNTMLLVGFGIIGLAGSAKSGLLKKYVSI